MYYVYVLQNLKSSNLYTAFTTDLMSSIEQHKNKKEFSTQGKTNFKLIYYEFCLHKQDAINREKYLKSESGKKYLTNRLKRFLAEGIK